MRDRDAALGQEFLDVSEAEGEAQVHPDRALDDVSWEAIARVRERGHADRLRCASALGKHPTVTSPRRALRRGSRREWPGTQVEPHGGFVCVGQPGGAMLLTRALDDPAAFDATTETLG